MNRFTKRGPRVALQIDLLIINSFRVHLLPQQRTGDAAISYPWIIRNASRQCLAGFKIQPISFD